MTKHLVVVAGNIGVGKTSLTERIGSRLGWWTGYESVADNPYLPDFYADMHAWAFHLQIFFLGHRADQYLEAAHDPRSAILDRSIYEDFHIFARALQHMGNMAERDYMAYKRLFDLVVDSLPRPNLLIYLKAPVEVLMERISPPRPQHGDRHHARLSVPAQFVLRRVVRRLRLVPGAHHPHR